MENLIFTPLQRQIIGEFARDAVLPKKFYFTGGTALSVFYYQHRWSEDLDFFSEERFDEHLVSPFIENLCKKLNASYFLRKTEIAYIYKLYKKGEEKDKTAKELMKIDFVYDFVKRIRIGEGKIYQGMMVDSLRDIGANKIMTISERFQVKDFVDLYFILQNDYSIWDLTYAVEAKRPHYKIDIVSLASDLAEAKEFQKLPDMIKPLKLDELKKFFLETAKKITGGVVIP